MRFTTSLLAFSYLSGTLAASSTQIPLSQKQVEHIAITNDACPLADKVAMKDGLISSIDIFTNPAIRLAQIDRLSQAVRIPTVSVEAEDDPWSDFFDPFLDLHLAFEQLFPLTHSYSKLEKVNRLGLVYTLHGTNAALKPVLLTAHQDVVPAGDIHDWTYPPFSAYFDGQWLWGRGSVDCKNVVIGVLSAVELLLAQGWTPTRTLIVAFGYDEESGGLKGAAKISRHLEQRYGANSFEFLLDEGGMGLQTLGENVYALPAVGEKGMLSINLALSTSGGHSSVPPPHTSIGIMAEVIYHMERQDLFTPRLDRSHPSRQLLQCQARYSPLLVEPWLWSELQSKDFEVTAERLAQSRGDTVRFTYQTSQATDLIRGGIKVNALPENVEATINYRVAIHQSLGDIKARAIAIATSVAEKYNITLSAFGKDIDGGGSGANRLNLTVFGASIEPSPITPSNTITSQVWARFSGIIRSVFESAPSLRGKQVVVAGDLMTGNTDTRYYWNLTRNIYRFSPRRENHALNLHTTDERIDIDVHLECMALYYDLIRGFDTWHNKSISS